MRKVAQNFILLVLLVSECHALSLFIVADKIKFYQDAYLQCTVSDYNYIALLYK